ncbi:MAG: hypothetical protein GX754_01835 [Clostridiaceae bacterium]|nr:hypothetical protein [Clostridiaceae bacterium]
MATNVLANPGDGTEGAAANIEGNAEGSTGEAETGENEGEEEISPFEAYLREIIKKADMEETEQFLVTLTEPSKDNYPMVFEKMNICGFLINGKTNPGEVVIVILARYNEETGFYEEIENTEGESRWKIGLFGLFAKEVRLPVGINKLKAVICKVPEKLASLLRFERKNTGEEVGLDEGEDVEESDVENNIAAENDTNAQDKLGEVDAENMETDTGETGTEDIIELVAGKDLQVNFFTIKVHDEATRNKLVNNKVNISDIFNNIVVPK